MHGWHPGLILAGACALLVGGCLAPRSVPDAPRAGLDRYILATGTTRSDAGCRFSYRDFSPTDDNDDRSPGATLHSTTTPHTVILGHGFLRSQGTLTALARALANAGHRTLTLDFCNMRPWNGHHRRNAADMRALGRRLSVRQPIYAGFSAGALAAVLAGAADSRTLGVLLLDPVDQGELGASAIDRLEVPVAAVFGEPSSCNAFNRMQGAVADARSVSIARVPGASHCEFEAPTNWVCETFCGDGRSDTGSDTAQREAVIAKALAAIRAMVN